MWLGGEQPGLQAALRRRQQRRRLQQMPAKQAGAHFWRSHYQLAGVKVSVIFTGSNEVVLAYVHAFTSGT